jgi:hypothetical protein
LWLHLLTSLPKISKRNAVSQPAKIFVSQFNLQIWLLKDILIPSGLKFYYLQKIWVLLIFYSLAIIVYTTSVNISKFYTMPTVYLYVLYVSKKNIKFCPMIDVCNQDVFTVWYKLGLQIKQTTFHP